LEILVAIRIYLFGVFVTATDHNRIQLNAGLELYLILEVPITHLVKILNRDLRSSELIQKEELRARSQITLEFVFGVEIRAREPFSKNIHECCLTPIGLRRPKPIVLLFTISERQIQVPGVWYKLRTEILHRGLVSTNNAYGLMILGDHNQR